MSQAIHHSERTRMGAGAMGKCSGLTLIRELCGLFGPSGCEDAVRDYILAQLEGDCHTVRVDKSGNIIACVRGNGPDYNPNAPRRILLSAHMDEVGFMITDILEDGCLRFGCVGGIDPRVLPGCHVRVGDRRPIQGVIASKAIHLQTAEERKKVVPQKDLCIDIGAKDAEDARRTVAVGDWAVFDSDFCLFGQAESQVKAKALDDRVGCAVLLETMRALYRDPADRPFDVYFAFTCCEEVGISGASVAAFGVDPAMAIVLEATAVHDLPDVSVSARVAKLGDGPAISLADNGTIYDRALVDYALATAAHHEIPCQIKQAVAGANDAAHIQRTLEGIRVLAVSLPTRYIHSPSCVASVADLESMKKLIAAMLKDAPAQLSL